MVNDVNGSCMMLRDGRKTGELSAVEILGWMENRHCSERMKVTDHPVRPGPEHPLPQVCSFSYYLPWDLTPGERDC